MKRRIIASLAPLQSQNNYKSNIETELLFGEVINVLNFKNDWLYCENVAYKYNGWIEKKFIGENLEYSHNIINKNTIAYNKPNVTSPYIMHLYLNSKVLIKNSESDWSEIVINTKNFNTGFIPSSHIIKADEVNKKNWIDYAKEFVGVPYLLGGKSIKGIDCSGLVQLSLETNKIKFPRNTCDQISFVSNDIYDTNSVDKGCLIFWEGHVAIALNDKEIIHSNAYHMEVKIERLDEVVTRSLSMNKKILKIKKINL